MKLDDIITGILRDVEKLKERPDNTAATIFDAILVPAEEEFTVTDTLLEPTELEFVAIAGISRAGFCVASRD
jgi:hypothetical protein